MFTASKIHFCHQTWQLDSAIQLIDEHSNYTDIVVDSTPFHPVSHIWPDHPADKGYLLAKGQQLEVIDCLVGAIELDTKTLYVGSAIPVKRDCDGWVFVVVHRIAKGTELCVGQVITLEVDKAYQQSLSRGHSAGHIASLALNKVLATSYWRKEAERKDGLAHYDFNSYAQEQSVVSPNRCFDRYRLGKTLKKRGLNTVEVVTDLQRIEDMTNQQLAEWSQEPSEVSMQLEGPFLTSSRYWHCTLDGVDVVMPCGGTHINHMDELINLRVELKAVDSSYIEMHTHVSD